MSDIEPTQALPLSDYDNETDDEQGDSERKPVARLKISCQKGLSETTHEIFKGENIIGRDPTCSVHIPVKALSKQHACIEIKGESHLIYDKGSRNKTRKERLILEPEVRYELKHGDHLVLADVKCLYSVLPRTPKAKSSLSKVAKEIGLEAPTQMYSGEDDDEPSSDLLQSPQFGKKNEITSEKKTVGLGDPTLMYAVDSDEDEEKVPDKPFSKTFSVLETPADNREKVVKATNMAYIPESGSEGDNSKQMDGETLVYNESDDEDKELKQKMSVVATQAFMRDDSDEENMTVPDSEGFNSSGEGNPILNSSGKSGDLIATQAYGGKTPMRSPNQQADGATVSYTLDVNDTDSKDTGRRKQNTSSGHKPDETVPYELDIHTDRAEGKRSPKVPRGKKSPAKHVETERVTDAMDVEDANQGNKNTGNKSNIEAEKQTLLHGMDIQSHSKNEANEETDENERQSKSKTNEYSAPTQAVNNDEDEGNETAGDETTDDEMDSKKDNVEPQPVESNNNVEPQPVESNNINLGGGATLAFADSDEGSSDDEPIIPLRKYTGSPKDDATPIIANESTPNLTGTASEPTQNTNEDANEPTQNIHDVDDVAHEPTHNINDRETQVLHISETQPVSSFIGRGRGRGRGISLGRGSMSPPHKAEEATQLLSTPMVPGNDVTQDVNVGDQETQVLSTTTADSVAEKVEGSDLETQCIIGGNVPTQVLSDDNATTQILSPGDAPTQVIPNSGGSTQIVASSDTEATQVLGSPPSPGVKYDGKSPKSPDTTVTQTQMLGDGDSETTPTLHVSGTGGFKPGLADVHDKLAMGDAETQIVSDMEVTQIVPSDATQLASDTQTPTLMVEHTPVTGRGKIKSEVKTPVTDLATQLISTDETQYIVPDSEVATQMVAENTDKTQLLDTSDDFPTLALEVTPEVVRKVKKITEEETQPLPDSDAATQILGNDDAVATQEFVVPDVPPKRKRPHKKSHVKPSADKSQKTLLEDETQVISPDLGTKDTQIINSDIETQVYANNNDEPTVAIPASDSDETQIMEENLGATTQAYTAGDTDATQAYEVDSSMSEEEEVYTLPELPDTFASLSPTANPCDALQATQAYEMSPERDRIVHIYAKRSSMRSPVKVSKDSNPVHVYAERHSLRSPTKVQLKTPDSLSHETVDSRLEDNTIKVNSEETRKRDKKDSRSTQLVAHENTKGKARGRGRGKIKRFAEPEVGKSTPSPTTRRGKSVVETEKGRDGSISGELQAEMSPEIDNQNKPKLRGRRPAGSKVQAKVTIEGSENQTEIPSEIEVQKKAKPRGRKPASGKVQEKVTTESSENQTDMPTEIGDQPKARPRGRRPASSKVQEAVAAEGNENQTEMSPEIDNQNKTKPRGRKPVSGKMQEKTTAESNENQTGTGLEIDEHKKPKPRGRRPASNKEEQKVTTESIENKTEISTETDNQKKVKTRGRRPGSGKVQEKVAAGINENQTDMLPEIEDQTKAKPRGRKSASGSMQEKTTAENSENQNDIDPEIDEQKKPKPRGRKPANNKEQEKVTAAESKENQAEMSPKIDNQNKAKRRGRRPGSGKVQEKAAAGINENQTDTDPEIDEQKKPKPRGRKSASNKEQEKVTPESNENQIEISPKMDNLKKARPRGRKPASAKMQQSSESQTDNSITIDDQKKSKPKGRGPASKVQEKVTTESSFDQDKTPQPETDYNNDEMSETRHSAKNRKSVGKQEPHTALNTKELGKRASRGKMPARYITDQETMDAKDKETKKMDEMVKLKTEPTTSQGSPSKLPSRKRGRQTVHEVKEVFESSAGYSEGINSQTAVSELSSVHIKTENTLEDIEFSISDVSTDKSPKGRGRKSERTPKQLTKVTRRNLVEKAAETAENVSVTKDSNNSIRNKRGQKKDAVDNSSTTEVKDVKLSTDYNNVEPDEKTKGRRKSLQVKELLPEGISSRKDESTVVSVKVETENEEPLRRGRQSEEKQLDNKKEHKMIRGRGKQNKTEQNDTLIETTRKRKSDDLEDEQLDDAPSSKKSKQIKTAGKVEPENKSPVRRGRPPVIKQRDNKQEQKMIRGRGKQNKSEETEALVELTRKRKSEDLDDDLTDKAPASKKSKQNKTVSKETGEKTDIEAGMERPDGRSPRGRKRKSDNLDSENGTQDSVTLPEKAKRETTKSSEETLSLSQRSSRGRRSNIKREADENSETQESKRNTPKRSSRRISAVGPGSSATHFLRQGSTEAPKVMFTGIEDDKMKKVVKALGGELVDTIEECTHLITDQVRRTVKFLCGVAQGIHIVHISWLEKSEQKGAFLDAEKFIIRDNGKEKQYGFDLLQSLHKAKRSDGLLKGYKVHVTKSVKPAPPQMQEIITSAGGEYLKTMPKKCAAGDAVIVISCESDESVCKAAVAAGIPIVNQEFILTGILKQEMNIDLYRIFTDSSSGSERNSTKRRGKKF